MNATPGATTVLNCSFYLPKGAARMAVPQLNMLFLLITASMVALTPGHTQED
jgi:hypothetical protein